MPADIKIKDFDKNEDAESLIEIYKLCSDGFQFEEQDHELLFGLSDMPGFKFVVALADNKIAGFGGALFYGNGSELGPIAVHPDFRNRGIGSKLVKYLLKFLGSKKAEMVVAHTKSGNKKALKFLMDFGFEYDSKFVAYSWGEIIQLVKHL